MSEFVVSRENKKKAEKLMSRFYILDAMIESRRIALEPSVTQNYDVSPAQRSNQFHSATENQVLAEIQLEEYVNTKRILTVVYNQLQEKQKEIWEQRYILFKRDMDIYTDPKVDMHQKAYYKAKRELVAMVAEAFGLIERKGAEEHGSHMAGRKSADCA